MYNHYTMILLYIILLLVLVYFIFFINQFFNIIFHGYPPFISTSQLSLIKIIELTNINETDVIYELGCGRARFLRIIESAHPKARLIGVENLLSIFLINWFRLKLQGSKIKLLNKNLFDINLKEANLIYCYLNQALMFKLGAKIIKECLPGTQIISQAFSISQLTPVKVSLINHKKVYFYIV